jgi:uncharacterized protein
MITIAQARACYEAARDSAHDFDHVLRVLAMAERIARAEGADLEIVRAAALLHDVGRAQEARTGGDHAAIGAQRAREILDGCPPDRVQAVAEAILTHRFRVERPPRTLEARVLYDADKLDAIGAIGIARAYAVAGREASPLWGEVPEHYQGDSPLHTPRHEFAFKLVHIQSKMQTDTGRQIAQERHRYMVAFFRRLEQEVCGQR